ncbi:unnamed protein product [Pleuronectes platessa]|uniref:Uncharacterized protein n=1 Tax=Pleuronectes platessa TaxID=8262 RepID=A0A9N7UM46_PLEPL|nr:unnamed protein product [Pleuronectes platessa]
MTVVTLSERGMGRACVVQTGSRLHILSPACTFKHPGGSQNNHEAFEATHIRLQEDGVNLPAQTASIGLGGGTQHISVLLKSDLSTRCLRACDRRMMETGEKPDPEAEEQVPDNTVVGSVDTSGFEVTAERLEQLMKGMEVLLSDVEQLRGDCSHQATELIRSAVDLKQQQEELKESYSQLSREMQEITDTLESLFETESTFEAEEKQEEEKPTEEKQEEEKQEEEKQTEELNQQL